MSAAVSEPALPATARTDSISPSHVEIVRIIDQAVVIVFRDDLEMIVSRNVDRVDHRSIDDFARLPTKTLRFSLYQTRCELAAFLSGYR